MPKKFKLGFDIDGTINNMNAYLNSQVKTWLATLNIYRTNADMTKYLIEDRFGLNPKTAEIIMKIINYNTIPILSDFRINYHYIEDPTIEVYFISHRDPELPQMVIKDYTDLTIDFVSLEAVTIKQLRELSPSYAYRDWETDRKSVV